MVHGAGSDSQSAAEFELPALRRELVALRAEIVSDARARLEPYAGCYPSGDFTASSLNLAHYVSLRKHDLRSLQERLAEHGLSSLGRSEAHVIDTLDKVIDLLGKVTVPHRDLQESASPAAVESAPQRLSYRAGRALLRENTDSIFGPPPERRQVRVMVTLPSEAATDRALLMGLMQEGMDCARINCAHDDLRAWEKMIALIRDVELSSGRRCRVMMDLPGHKIRTAVAGVGMQQKPGFEEQAGRSSRVMRGEAILLVRAVRPGRDSEPARLVMPAKSATEDAKVQISCTYPGVCDLLRVGDPVWIDDGEIGGVVESIDAAGARVRLVHLSPHGARIKHGKGMNFPETELDLPALSSADERALDFVASHADLVGYSFVRSLADMDRLVAELAVRGASRLPIIAKIETRQAVKNLPDILLGTIGRHRVGVMIARGDLAVEVGGERMAEVQEELLWLCEAAHVPVIWATQVLESLAKRGIASRPELTDAAMGERAECVMLNKGPYILEAVRTLIDILGRMQAHQQKKRSQLRALHW